MKAVFNLFVIGFVVILLSGCRSLNPSVMLKTSKDYKYAAFPVSPPIEYKIAPNDQISFTILANDGFKWIDMISTSEGMTGRAGNRGGLSFQVEFDGTVKLPLLGRTKIQGMTVRETENFLEEKYATFYNKPYVIMQVSNRRVIVFPGSAAGAKVVGLSNENTTLMEALAEAGGIASSGKAYKVKLIRGSLKNPDVYLIDLSTLDGVKNADMILQANDIIYIEPQLRVGRDAMAEILPWLSFITTMIVFYEFISRKVP